MKKRLVFTLLVAVFVGSVPLYAIETEEQRNIDTVEPDVVAQQDEQRQDSHQAKTALRCERAQTQLQRHLDSSDDIKQKSLKRYDRLIDVLNNIIVRLETNHPTVYTQPLEDDVSGFNDLVADFESDFGEYQARLRISVNVVCGTDGDITDLREAIALVRGARDTLRVDSKEVHDYVRETVRDNLESVREDLANSDTQAGETSQ